jgi:hypothetical protein
MDQGLKVRCITRDLKWGTPVPLDGYADKVGHFEDGILFLPPPPGGSLEEGFCDGGLWGPRLCLFQVGVEVWVAGSV